MIAAVVLSALGCYAPRSAGYGYAAGYGGDTAQVESAGAYADESEDYGYREEAADEAVAMEAPAPAKARFKESKKLDRERDQSVSSTNTATPTGSSEAEPPPPPEPAPEDGPAPTHGRQIIYTAGLILGVFGVDDVMAKLEAIPERHGGWLQQRYDNQVILRVPAAKLKRIIAEVSEWGVVEAKTLEALDVTAEYTDLDSRIRVLEQMQVHLQALLARAENVEQALKIQVELARITAELEQLRAQMRMLDSSISFSTLAVTLRERTLAEPEPGDDPFPWVDELGAEATAYR